MRIYDAYPKVDEFENLLEDADSNAGNQWELEFVSDINERFEKYGGDTFISKKQIEILNRIARGE